MVRKALKKWRKQQDEERRRHKELDQHKEERGSRLGTELTAALTQPDPEAELLPMMSGSSGREPAYGLLWDIFAPAEPLLRRGMELLQERNYDQALAALTQAAAATPHEPEVFFYRARVHQAQDHPDLALEDINRAIAIRPTAMYFKERSSVHAHAGRHEQALADATEALQLSSGRLKSSYHHLRARRLFALDRYDEAAEDCTEALRIYPAVAIPPLTLRGRCRYRTNRDAEAIEDWTAVLRLEPNNQFARMMRGISRTRLEQWDAAIEDLTAALAQEPHNAELLWHRGWCYHRLERLVAAVIDYTELLTLRPEDDRALGGRASCLAKLSRYEEAIADQQTLLRIDANDYRHWLGLASCLGLADRVEEALEAATRAVQLAPLVAECRLMRAQILRALDRVLEAVLEEQAAAGLN